MTRIHPLHVAPFALLVASAVTTRMAHADEPPGQAPPAAWLDEPPPTEPAAEGIAAAPAATPEAPVVAKPAASAQVAAVFHHAPVSSATAGDDVVFQADLDDPHLVRALTLVHRVGAGAFVETRFARSDVGYRAVLPGAQVQPGLAYAVELTTSDGQTIAVFGARDALHPIQVLPDAMDEHERELLRRLGGRRSSAAVSGEYVDFGGVETPRGTVTDRYWGVEGRYTYRPLRTVAEFGFRGGVVRGTSPANVEPTTGEQPDVGLNYGASNVRLRITDLWHIELEALASISDEGFSTGGGTSILVGNPYGSKLVLGASFVGLSADTYFGSRFYSRVDLPATERVTVSPTIEITDMPNADRYGVRLLTRVDVEIGGGFSAQIGGGYQARRAASGGPAIDGGLTLDF